MEPTPEVPPTDDAPEPVVEPVVIDADGVYPDLTDEQYHGDPWPGGSLSSTGARLLIPPSCPALFLNDQQNGRPPKRTFDYGHAAHARVLGAGAQTVIVQTTAKDGTKTPAADYRTKSAQQHAADIRAFGNVPILEKEDGQVSAMAAALRQNETAAKLLDADTGGLPEVSLFWTDPDYLVTTRVRLDWLPGGRSPDGRLIVADYKTTTSAHPRDVRQSIGSYRYHIQDAWYRRAMLGLRLVDDPDELAFVFIFQEKTAPFLVTVAQIDATALRAGQEACQESLATYVRCRRTGIWPGYTDDVVTVELPPYLLTQHRGEADPWQ